MSKITVVGCGKMGGNIIDAFLDHRHDVTIVDVDCCAAEPRVARGARFCEVLADALDASFVLFSLPTDEVVRSVLSACDPAALDGAILVNATSEVPSDVISLERDVRALGARYVDAAILTYQGEVGRDDACLLYSGDRTAFDTIAEDLKALSPMPLFLGEEVSVAAEIVDIVAVAVHYGLTYAPLEGIARCAESGIDVDEYLACLGDLLIELDQQSLPRVPLTALAASPTGVALDKILGLMREHDLFERLSAERLASVNRGVGAHLSKVLGIAESNFSY